MKKLKIGIIGVGRLGYEHACNIANRVPGSELVAICDANFDRAKQVAEELAAEAKMRSLASPPFTTTPRRFAMTRTSKRLPLSPIPPPTWR